MSHKVYMAAASGPFRCDHCTWYGPAERCDQPDIVKLLGAGSDGKAKVDAGACSDYFDPMDETWEGDSDATVSREET